MTRQANPFSVGKLRHLFQHLFDVVVENREISSGVASGNMESQTATVVIGPYQGLGLQIPAMEMDSVLPYRAVVDIHVPIDDKIRHQVAGEAVLQSQSQRLDILLCGNAGAPADRREGDPG